MWTQSSLVESQSLARLPGGMVAPTPFALRLNWRGYKGRTEPRLLFPREFECSNSDRCWHFLLQYLFNFHRRRRLINEHVDVFSARSRGGGRQLPRRGGGECTSFGRSLAWWHLFQFVRRQSNSTEHCVFARPPTRRPGCEPSRHCASADHSRERGGGTDSSTSSSQAKGGLGFASCFGYAPWFYRGDPAGLSTGGEGSMEHQCYERVRRQRDTVE